MESHIATHAVPLTVLKLSYKKLKGNKYPVMGVQWPLHGLRVSTGIRVCKREILSSAQGCESLSIQYACTTRVGNICMHTHNCINAHVALLQASRLPRPSWSVLMNQMHCM